MANAFESELAASFKKLGWWHHKLSVSASMSSTIRRFTGKVPFDFIALTPEMPIGIEAKSNKEFGSFAFNRLADHQITGLLEFRAAGWPAYIFINFRKPKNISYAVEILDWVTFIKESTRKSVPKTAFSEDERFVEIPRRKVEGSTIWDVRSIEDIIESKGRKKWPTNSNPAPTISPSSPSKSKKQK